MVLLRLEIFFMELMNQIINKILLIIVFLCLSNIIFAQKVEVNVLKNKSITTITGSSIDISANNLFQKILTDNITFTFLNFPENQQVYIFISNPSNYTVSWPSIDWKGETSPTQSTSNKTDLYVLEKIGSVIYGRQRANFTYAP